MRHLLLAAPVVFLSGCASIMHGTSQDIGFSSTPTSAKVTVDGAPYGNTPVVVKLARKNNHIVRMQLDGYQPFEVTLTKSTSGWVWGNLVFGGLIGLAVDAVSGGLYNLSPEQITGVLSQGAVPQGRPPEVSRVGNVGLLIAVVLRPDPAWQRVGTLQRLEEE
jgi:hypothetical protein